MSLEACGDAELYFNILSDILLILPSLIGHNISNTSQCCAAYDTTSASKAVSGVLTPYSMRSYCRTVTLDHISFSSAYLINWEPSDTRSHNVFTQCCLSRILHISTTKPASVLTLLTLCCTISFSVVRLSALLFTAAAVWPLCSRGSSLSWVFFPCSIRDF